MGMRLKSVSKKKKRLGIYRFGAERKGNWMSMNTHLSIGAEGGFPTPGFRNGDIRLWGLLGVFRYCTFFGESATRLYAL